MVAPASCLAPALPVVQLPGDRFDGDHLVDAGRRRRRLHHWRPRRRPADRRSSPSRWRRRTTSVAYPGVPRGHLLRAGDRHQSVRRRRRPRPTPRSTVTAPPAADRAADAEPAGADAAQLPAAAQPRGGGEEMARLYPGELRASCGNNTWLFRLVQRLRQEDTRWGLNWKRSRVGDMSQDAITYNYGPEADEGTRFVHVVDVIGGHCGSNPGGGLDRPDGPVVDRRHLDAAAIPRRRLPAVGRGPDGCRAPAFRPARLSPARISTPC